MAIVCAACGQENRPAARFCVGCGAAVALARARPSCGEPVADADRFCAACGSRLARQSATSEPPVAAVDRRFVVREREGERKQLTVLFADVQGSMELQEELDVEAWADIVDVFVNILADAVRRFGGTVDKFTGDGIMALFGAPEAQEDHARRACHAAWLMTRAIRAYADELRRAKGLDLHVRVGLNSGEAVVGRVGDDGRLDPTALGHTVGLA
jgi:class 3 adenylate cyclase